jgi:antitoxin (DNA-binding transcriptional repressor) of toxin-antitoxin stability system
VRDFKNGVSGYLDRVESGEVLTVTRHGKPVARVIPAGISPGMASLIAEGKVRWSGRKPKLPKPVKLEGEGKTIAEVVSEGRD